METINRLANPPYLSAIRQLERTIERFSRQHQAISRALETYGAATRFKEIAIANQRWQDTIIQTSASVRIAENLHATHQSWLDQIDRLKSGSRCRVPARGSGKAFAS